MDALQKLVSFRHLLKGFLVFQRNDFFAEVARVNEFLSVGVDASTLLISENLENTTAKVTTDGSKPEVNMLVKTSLNVDDKNTTLGVSKEEEVIATTESTKEKKLKSGEVTSHVLESTTTVEFLENKISEKSNEIVEGSGENLTPETTTVTLETVQTRRPKRKQFNAENMTDCYTSIIGLV